MLLRIWRQHPLCFGDVVSRTERCILYDGRPFDLRTYRLETEAGSKLTQLGLMARCRQIRQQQSFAGINLRSYIAPRKHQRNTFFCTTVLFLGVLKQWFHRWSYRAARIEKNALYQHQHGNLQVKNPASPKFCACFFLIFEWQNSQVVQSRPQCQKNITCSWRIFSANKRTRSTTTESHKCLKMHFWKHLQLYRQRRAVHSQIVDSGSLNDTYWNLKMNFTFTGSVDRCFSCLGFRFWRKKSIQGHWIFAVHWSCNVSLHVVFMATWVILKCQNG